MRIVGNIPHRDLTITVFSMNEKYVIKFEAGQMEQVFKVSQAEVSGIAGIQKMLNEEFMSKVLARFNEMFLSFEEAKEKL